MRTETSERSTGHSGTWDLNVKDSWEELNGDLRTLAKLDARGRLQVLQEWGDLERLHLGARNGHDHQLGDAHNPFRPSEGQCVAAFRNLSIRWTRGWQPSSQPIEEAALELAHRKGTHPRVIKQEALVVGIIGTCQDARQFRVTWSGRALRGTGSQEETPMMLRAVDLFPSKFRTWTRRKAFRRAEDWLRREAPKPTSPAGGMSPSVSADTWESSIAGTQIHLLELPQPVWQVRPDPILRVLDIDTVRHLLDSASATEQESLHQLRRHHVEDGLPRAEAIRVIAGKMGASVEEVHSTLWGLAERISG